MTGFATQKAKMHHKTKGHRVRPSDKMNNSFGSCRVLLVYFLLLVHLSKSVISYANLFLAWATLGHAVSGRVGRGCKFSLCLVLLALICLQVGLHIFHFHQMSAICKLKCFQNV